MTLINAVRNEGTGSSPILPCTAAHRAHVDEHCHEVIEKIEHVADHLKFDPHSPMNLENLKASDLNQEDTKEKSKTPDPSTTSEIMVSTRPRSNSPPAVNLSLYLDITTLKEFISAEFKYSPSRMARCNLFSAIKNSLIKSAIKRNGPINEQERKTYYGFHSEETYWDFLKIPEIKESLKKHISVPSNEARISDIAFHDLTQVYKRHMDMNRFHPINSADSSMRTSIDTLIQAHEADLVTAIDIFEFIKYTDEPALKIIQNYLIDHDLKTYIGDYTLDGLHNYLKTQTFEAFQKEHKINFRGIVEHMLLPILDKERFYRFLE